MHWMRWPRTLAFEREGNKSPAKMASTAMTSSSSTKVNAIASRQWAVGSLTDGRAADTGACLSMRLHRSFGP